MIGNVVLFCIASGIGIVWCSGACIYLVPVHSVRGLLVHNHRPVWELIRLTTMKKLPCFFIQTKEKIKGIEIDRTFKEKIGFSILDEITEKKQR